MKNALWIGELPLMVLIQIPITASAHWCRDHVVIPVIRWAGYSLSASPESIMARPYGLALVYFPILAIAIAAFLWRWRRDRAVDYLAILVFAAAIINYFMMLRFAGGPGLTFY